MHIMHMHFVVRTCAPPAASVLSGGHVHEARMHVALCGGQRAREEDAVAANKCVTVFA